jgi:hypothetical protein
VTSSQHVVDSWQLPFPVHAPQLATGSGFVAEQAQTASVLPAFGVASNSNVPTALNVLVHEFCGVADVQSIPTAECEDCTRPEPSPSNLTITATCCAGVPVPDGLSEQPTMARLTTTSAQSAVNV